MARVVASAPGACGSGAHATELQAINIRVNDQ